MRLFESFAKAFLIFFGVFILYFNLFMAMDIVGQGSGHLSPFLGLYSVDDTRWGSDYYFGFSSIMQILGDLPKQLNFANFLEDFKEFVGSLNVFGDFLYDYKAPDLIDSNFWEILGNMLYVVFGAWFNIIIAPFKMLYHFIVLNVHLFQTLIELFNFVWSMINGKYNTPIDSAISSPFGILTSTSGNGYFIPSGTGYSYVPITSTSY